MSNSAKATNAAGSLGKELAVFTSSLEPSNLRERSVQVEIDDILYTSTKFSARRGLEILPRVGALLGAALTPIMSAGESGDFDLRVFEEVADRAMRDGLGPLAIDLLSSMDCNALKGQKDNCGNVAQEFDEHFAGEYVHLIKVLLFSLYHNFRGFSRGSL